MKYYSKSLPDTPITLSNGVRFKFEKYPDGRGYLATEEPNLIRELGLAIERKVGGVTEITQAEYDAQLKKNLTYIPPVKPSPRPWPLLSNPLPDREPARPPRERAVAVKDASNAPVVPALKPGMPIAALRGKWVPKAVTV